MVLQKRYTCILQVENPVREQVKDDIEACIVALESLRHFKGPHLQKLQFPTKSPESGITDWNFHEIKDTPKQRKDYNQSVELFLDCVTTSLSTLPTANDIATSFGIFEPNSPLAGTEED